MQYLQHSSTADLRCVGRSSCSSSEDVEISRGIREAFKEPFGFQGSVTFPVVSASLLLSHFNLHFGTLWLHIGRQQDVPDIQRHTHAPQDVLLATKVCS